MISQFTFLILSTSRLDLPPTCENHLDSFISWAAVRQSRASTAAFILTNLANLQRHS